MTTFHDDSSRHQATDDLHSEVTSSVISGSSGRRCNCGYCGSNTPPACSGGGSAETTPEDIPITTSTNTKVGAQDNDGINAAVVLIPNYDIGVLNDGHLPNPNGPHEGGSYF